MKRKILLASVVAVTLLASCSKTIILSDGNTTRTIKVASAIELKKDEANNTVLSFESLNGTKYTIDASKYTYKIK